VPQATKRLARPHSNASRALMARPVSIKSRARDSPTKACSRTVPPSNKGTPVDKNQFKLILISLSSATFVCYSACLLQIWITIINKWLWTGWPGFNSLQGCRDPSLHYHIQKFWGLCTLLYNGYQNPFPNNVKCPECETALHPVPRLILCVEPYLQVPHTPLWHAMAQHN